MITKKYLRLFGLLLCCAMLSISCSDDNDEGNNGGSGDGDKEIPNYSQKVKNSVYGFITNEFDTPMMGALVKCGDQTATTDENGYFEIKDVSVTKSLGVVTAEAASYFKGIRTWAASADSEGFVRIKLIPKTVKGTFAASEGGNVELPNGLKLAFPADVIVDEATGAAYSGNVSVSLAWINPMGENFAEEMPGDLSAVNAEGYLRSLVSYGMVAAELRGESNQKLQIAKDKKVTVTAPIEQEQLSLAPETMPLWLFDEAKGVWIERGEAKKEGNKYVGEFDHFSYWNLDIPYTPCIVTAKFVDENDKPIANQKVLLEGKTGNQLYGFYANTNSDGVVQVRSVSNTAATIMLKTERDCTIYSKSFNAQGTSLNLGTIKVLAANLADKKYTISGTVVDCDNQPVANGSAFFTIDNANYIAIIKDGKYELITYACDAMPSVTIKVFDHKTMKANSVTVSGITSKNHTVAPITACGTNITADSYIKYEADGKEYLIIMTEFDYYFNYFSHDRNPSGGDYGSALSYAEWNNHELSKEIKLSWREYTSVPTVGTFPIYWMSLRLIDTNEEYGWSSSLGAGGGSVTLTKYAEKELPDKIYEYDLKGSFELKGAKSLTSEKTIDIKGEFAYKGKSLIIPH